MILYIVLKNGSMVSVYDVDTITRIDPLDTFTVHGIVFDYSIVSHVWYINNNVSEGSGYVRIFEDGRFICSPHDCLKYIQPIRDSEGVHFDA